ncbi:hypothetical protein D9758_018771 [Tetrapyrgos nigripes]|uniref:CHAT domain-containing protein n=1 Tax=Tetrapyrgos nigripes TaxID=182062 RepID=A0A8H5BTF0_9AGAR|nr:hypothetical protein D9758_018771 [Tetrapyrgos nigripes]
MSESNIPLEDPMRIPATDTLADKALTQPTPNYHKNGAVEPEMAINMSLGSSNAETTEDSFVNHTPIDMDEWVELASLPLELFDEQVAQLHQRKVHKSNNSVMELLEHFKQSGDCAAIEDAVQLFGEAVDLTPDSHASKASWLNKLGNAFESRFQRLGELGDIENAIGFMQQAVDLIPDDHADKASWLSNLGNAFESRFQWLGELGDIEKATGFNQQAVDLTPDGHADKASWLNNLGTVFQTQFEHLGEVGDIEKAIGFNQQAVNLTPDGHASRPSRLNNLGTAFWSRFEHLGELGDMEKAIGFNQQAVDLTPDDHANKASLLLNLGNAFQSRFKCLGEQGDIEKAIGFNQQAVNLIPDGHADKASWLTNLGNAFQRRFECLGELGDIEKAIGFNQQAVDLTPDGHADKASWLNNLGAAFQTRFEHLGKLGDMEKAISFNQQAVKLTPDGHASRPSQLNNLGIAFQIQFDHLGGLGDMENAIGFMQQAVDLTPDGHANKASRLSNLGNAFQSRFQHLRELGDIENAIGFMCQAVDLTPDSHADKAFLLSNLGTAFQRRFEHLGELGDIKKAIGFKQQAVDLTPDGHASKASQLNNLGIAFQTQFEHLGELGDMEKAIGFNQQAVDLTPDGHAEKASWLNNLGTAFQTLFEHLGELGDIEKAIGFKQQAVDLTPDGHADKASWLSNLGNSLEHRFEHLGQLGDIMKASAVFQQATKNTSSPPSIRFKSACNWATLCLAHQGSSSALDAYKVVLEIIPQLVWLGQTVHQRYKELPKIGRTINAAVATAISVGNLTQAFEWLEEGRGIVWGQILQLQSPLDDLHDQYPLLAKDLERASRALQNAGTSTRSNIVDNPNTHAALTGGQEAQQHTRWAAEYEELLAKVRKLDGFDSFLKPKKLSALTPAAANGPIIIINVDQSRCDALVLSSSSDIIHVPLPNFSSEQAKEMYSAMNSSLQDSRVRVDCNDERYSQPHPVAVQHRNHLKLILARLWSTVVQRILSEIEDVLQYSAEGGLPHITWCATGALAFLPLHAAGIYCSQDASDNIKLSDFAVSSYTTTLSAMLSSGCNQPQKDWKEKPKILIISQPASLPWTEEEARIIQTYTSPEQSQHLTRDKAIVDTVKSEMSKYEIIHLACHGIQDPNPLDSAFVLYDGRLKLHDLMGLSLESAELAFLSACQTAAGDENLPEEAVHLAAGMLAVGYPSVIATMWSIRDKDAPIVADKFYESLLGRRDSEMATQNPRQSAAYALHAAVEHLRKEVGETAFVKWVPFIHYGV